MMHFVIVNDWANEYENGTTILGVEHSLEKAKKVFQTYLEEEKKYAEEHGFTIYEDCDTIFDAGEDGYYISNHTNLYIQGV